MTEGLATHAGLHGEGRGRQRQGLWGLNGGGRDGVESGDGWR